MGISFKHQAAGIAPSPNSQGRKYGQSLVLQQRQFEQANQQRAADRKYDLGKMQIGAQIQRDRDELLIEADQVRDDRRIQADKDLAQQRADAIASQRISDFGMEQNRQLDLQRGRDIEYALSVLDRQASTIFEDIDNGRYDKDAARDLAANIREERKMLRSRQWDATQKAEFLEQIRADRFLMTLERKKPKPPSAPVMQPPANAREVFSADGKERDYWLGEAAKLYDNDITQAKPSRGELLKKAIELYEEEQRILAGDLPRMVPNGGSYGRTQWIAEGSQPPSQTQATDMMSVDSSPSQTPSTGQSNVQMSVGTDGVPEMTIAVPPVPDDSTSAEPTANTALAGIRPRQHWDPQPTDTMEQSFNQWQQGDGQQKLEQGRSLLPQSDGSPESLQAIPAGQIYRDSDGNYRRRGSHSAKTGQ